MNQPEYEITVKVKGIESARDIVGYIQAGCSRNIVDAATLDPLADSSEFRKNDDVVSLSVDNVGDESVSLISGVELESFELGPTDDLSQAIAETVLNLNTVESVQADDILCAHLQRLCDMQVSALDEMLKSKDLVVSKEEHERQVNRISACGITKIFADDIKQPVSAIGQTLEQAYGLRRTGK